MYKDGCKGCDLSRGQGTPLGGIVVELDDYWTLNQSKEGFLGWMILQPKQHRMELADLTWDEVTALGRNIQRIDLALTRYWDYHFKDDRIDRVYIVYFFESYWDAPKKCEWHFAYSLNPPY